VGLGLEISSEDSVAFKLLSLAWHVTGMRAWSLSRYSIPPECYAEFLFKPGVFVKPMQDAWTIVTQLEQRAHQVPAAARILQDMDFTQAKAVRLMFCFFERDQWRSGSPAGRKLLKCLLAGLPDNKIVEDVHGVIRKDAKSNRNMKPSPAGIHKATVLSNVLESRGLQHAAAVQEEYFASRFRHIKYKRRMYQHYSSKHKLNPRWIKMCGKRDWRPCTEEGSHLSQAAWHWLCVRNGRQIDLALFSRLLFPQLLARSTESGQVYGSMGNASWGGLAWPVLVAGSSDGAQVFIFDKTKGVEWVHVTDPSQWEVIPRAATFSPAGGIGMKQPAEACALIRNLS
jgi:hypothetical protein